MVSWSTVIFGNSLSTYTIFFGVLLFGVLLGKAFSWLLQNIVLAFAKRTRNRIDDVMVDVLSGPLVFAVFIATLWYAERLLVLSPAGLAFYDGLLRVLITVNIAWLFIRFLDSVIEHFLVPYAEKSDTDLDDVLLPIVSSIMKIVVVAVVLIMILSDFGFNVAGLVAGLGIGGLAVAFAAKDIIGNFFGGISVIADKPFKIGDMIKFDNRQGTVKGIGIRTTRIETLDGTTLIIPNAKFTDGIIENVTRRKQHRIALTLNLQYDTTSKQLKTAKETLRKLIKEHKGTADDAIVFFSNFGPSSVDLLLIYFITDLKNIPAVQDEVNTLIKQRFEKARIQFAYPTQTVILKRK